MSGWIGVNFVRVDEKHFVVLIAKHTGNFSILSLGHLIWRLTSIIPSITSESSPNKVPFDDRL